MLLAVGRQRRREQVDLRDLVALDDRREAGGVGDVQLLVRQAFISEMTGPTLLVNAVSLNSTIFNGARLIGPAVAGLVIGASGGDTAPAFFVNAGSFAFTMGASCVSISSTISSSPKRAFQPQSLAASLSSIERGQLAAMAWRKSGTHAIVKPGMRC